MTWMRDAMLPLLVPLLKLAYNAAQNPEQQAKIMKVTFFTDIPCTPHNIYILILGNYILG